MGHKVHQIGSPQTELPLASMSHDSGAFSSLQQYLSALPSLAPCATVSWCCRVPPSSPPDIPILSWLRDECCFWSLPSLGSTFFLLAMESISL